MKTTTARPYLKVKIAEQDCNILFDTGSSITCISEQQFRKIPIDLRPQKSKIETPTAFGTAAGHTLNTRGLYEIPISVMGKIIKHPIHVISQLSEPAILGSDFMKQHGRSYCASTDSCHWLGNSPWTKGALRLTQAETVEPLSSKDI